MPELSLLTLNCFGVPTFATGPRLLALAQELNRSAYGVVCLQEVQTHGYAQLLVTACAAYSASASEPFVYAPKGGLLTLARTPIARQEFILYRERSVVSPLALMDWALHKGVLLTELAIGGRPVVVLNTHLNANYLGNWGRGGRYAEIERRQLLELAAIVRAQPAEALVVAAGDFNIPRGSWLYDEFLAASGMDDPLAGDPRPTLRLPRGLPARLAMPIDFTMIRLPALPGLTVRSDLCLERRQPLPGGRAGYLSDHLGVELQLAWEALPERHPEPGGGLAELGRREGAVAEDEPAAGQGPDGVG
jgi:endonuclease/exonuclease/phosphatase family metal-dependent hydrolase